MKMLQKMVAVVLGLCLAFCINVIPAFAMENNITTDTNTLVAKTAILNNIDEYGSNWGSDLTTDNACVVEDTLVSQSNNGDVITLNAYLDGQNVTITGTPLSKSENGNVTYFDGSVNNADYDVVLFSFEKEIQDSVVYFKGYMQENGKTDGNILKVYLKDNNSPTKDYIVLEVFDYELPFAESDIANLDVDALPGAWVADEFEPVSIEEIDEPITYGDQYPSKKTFKETFTAGGYEQTHTLELTFYNYSADMLVDSNSIQYSQVSITGKTISVPSAPNLNSSKQSYLYVSFAELNAYAGSYTAWIYTKISGSVTSSIPKGLTASFSAGIGPISGAIGPDFWTQNISMKIDNTYDSFVPKDPDYARIAKVTMDSHCKLTQIGDYFHVTGCLAGYYYPSSITPNSSSRYDWTIKVANSHGLTSTKTASYSFNCRVNIKK